ncbi:MAG: tetratricopeptide repeat protein [Planctomycetes bacterium]|nr:tetratricopeptide repeat protein [Planctomycetota bacterium]MBI3835591.1 tetratricopeptide repeat protein [Planctomycetota bacterium]
MAKKRLNKSVVVTISLVGFAAVFVIGVLIVRQLKQNDPKHFVEIAEKAAAQENWKEAATFYTQAAAVSQDPSFLVNVGEMWLREGEVGLALQRWRDALVQKPELMEAHFHQITLLLQIARAYGTGEGWQSIADTADGMLKVLEKKSGASDKDRAFAAHAHGLALVNLESRGEESMARGEKELREAIQLSPDTVEYSIDLATYLASNQRIKEADESFRDLIQRYSTANVDASKVRLAYAKYLGRLGKTMEADTAFRESVQLAGGDAIAESEAQLGYTNFLSQQWIHTRRDPSKTADSGQMFDKIESILKTEVQRNPENYDAYLQLALLYKLASRFDDAIQVCEQRLQKGVVRKGADATKNRVGTFTLMIYASEASLAKSLQLDSSADPATKAKALERAEQFVTQARGEAPNHPRILGQMGRLKMARGLDRQALRDFEDADAAYNNYGTINWENKMLLASLHLKLGESGAARTVLERVVDRARRVLTNEPTFWNLYTQSLFQTNELDRALSVADGVLSIDPKNNDAIQLKAAIFERQDKHAQASQLMESAIGSGPVRILLSARAATLQGDSEGAIRILRDALEKDPSEIRLVGAAVQELIAKQRYAEAFAIADRAMKLRPDDSNLKQLVVLSRGDLTPEQRDQALVEVLSAEPDEFKRALDLLIFYWRKNDLRKTLEQTNLAEHHLIAKDTPLSTNSTTAQHVALLKIKIRAAAQLNDAAALEAVRDSAVKFNVDGAGGKSIVGLYFMQRHEWNSALTALQEAVAAQPTDSASLTSIGQCLLAMNRNEQAQDAYERALRANPNEGLAHQGMAYLAQLRGDNDTFQKELAECERLIPEDSWVDEQVTMRNERGDPAAAIQRRERQLAEKPDDLQILQRLAWLYEITNDREKADVTFGKLLQHKDKDQKTILSAVGYYRRSGRGDMATELLKNDIDTKSKPEEKATAELMLAGEYLQQKENKKAEETLLNAAKNLQSPEVLQAVAEFYSKYADQPAKALPWLDKAIESARKDKLPQLANLLDARIGCLLSRSVGNLDAARKDAKELADSFPDFPRNFLWNSEIHARQGDIPGAVKALNDYLEKRPNDPYALYQRARHRIAQGQPTAAMEDLQLLKRTAPTALQMEPRYLLSNLQHEAGHNELWIAELESMVKDAPNSYAIIEKLVNAYAELRRFDDADRVVTAQINRGGADLDPRWYFLRGRVSIALGQPDKALDDFQKGAATAKFTASAIGSILDLYAKMGRFTDGAAFFEQHADSRSKNFTTLAKYAGLLARDKNLTKAAGQFRTAMNLAMSESQDAVRLVMEEVFAAIPGTEVVEQFRTAPAEPNLVIANDRILMLALSKANKYDDALRVADKLIAAAPNDAARGALLAEKGSIDQESGQIDKAIAEYEESLKYDAHNWVTLNNVAYLLSDKRGDNQKALDYAVQAANIAENQFTLDTLGWIYVGLSKESQAVAELSRSIRVNSEYALSYYHLGEARRRLGQFSDAEAILKTGRSLSEFSKDKDLTTLFDKSLEKVRKSDRNP